MKLTVAIWMEQNAIPSDIRTAHHPMDEVVVVPHGHLHRLVAQGAQPLLLLPQTAQLSATAEMVGHLGLYRSDYEASI